MPSPPIVEGSPLLRPMTRCEGKYVSPPVISSSPVVSSPALGVVCEPTQTSSYVTFTTCPGTPQLTLPSAIRTAQCQRVGSPFASIMFGNVAGLPPSHWAPFAFPRMFVPVPASVSVPGPVFRKSPVTCVTGAVNVRSWSSRMFTGKPSPVSRKSGRSIVTSGPV